MNPAFLTHAGIGGLVGLLGLVFGSFAGLCAYRIPRRIGVVVKHSNCPGCGVRIPAWRNVPVLSYALQRGRCAQCDRRIHWRYPYCEALCALLALACWFRYGAGLSLAAGSLLCCVLVLLSAIDLEHRRLPDRVTLLLLWLGLCFSLTAPEAPFVSPPDAIMGAAAGYGLLWLIDALWRQLGKRPAFGGGDLKLLAAMGAWLGFHGAFAALCAAAVTGSVYHLAHTLLCGAELRSELAFGPFLMLGGIWVLLGPEALMLSGTEFEIPQLLRSLS